MKKVDCSYKNCGDRRAHWQTPDTPRGTRVIEVADDYEGRAYCSLECGALDKFWTVSRREGYCYTCFINLDLNLHENCVKTQ